MLTIEVFHFNIAFSFWTKKIENILQVLSLSQLGFPNVALKISPIEQTSQKKPKFRAHPLPHPSFAGRAKCLRAAGATHCALRLPAAAATSVEPLASRAFLVDARFLEKKSLLFSPFFFFLPLSFLFPFFVFSFPFPFLSFSSPFLFLSFPFLSSPFPLGFRV